MARTGDPGVGGRGRHRSACRQRTRCAEHRDGVTRSKWGEAVTTAASRVIVALAAIAFAASSAMATAPDQKCRASKNRTAGKYVACLETAAKKLVVTGNTTKYATAVAKCADKFSDKWQQAEQHAADAGGACAPTGDEAAVKTRLDADAACIADALEGDTHCLTCGNGVVDAGEECDLGAVGGASCRSATGGALQGGTLDCAPGCVFDTSGCSLCGATIAGLCWLLGADGASCASTCDVHGLAVDPATTTYAGSSGTDGQCDAVLTAIGAGAPGVTATASSFGLGCAVTGSVRFRDTTPTVDAAGIVSIQRACACH
jgi:hypothetical protein